MEKLEFEQKIREVLISAGYMKKDQIVEKASIILDVGDLPEVNLRFKVVN